MLYPSLTPERNPHTHHIMPLRTNLQEQGCIALPSTWSPPKTASGFFRQIPQEELVPICILKIKPEKIRKFYIEATVVHSAKQK